MEQRNRSRRAADPIRSLRSRDHFPPATVGPLIVRFLEEDDDTYLVGEPEGSRTARVPKQRATNESYAPKQQRRQSSERLLRWSSYALVGVVCGGILGIALGSIVALATLARLARLSSDIRRWRRRQRTSQNQRVLAALPVEATRERMQLLAALGQSILAIALGGGVLFAIIEMR